MPSDSNEKAKLRLPWKRANRGKQTSFKRWLLFELLMLPLTLIGVAFELVMAIAGSIAMMAAAFAFMAVFGLLIAGGFGALGVGLQELTGKDLGIEVSFVRVVDANIVRISASDSEPQSYELVTDTGKRYQLAPSFFLKVEQSVQVNFPETSGSAAKDYKVKDEKGAERRQNPAEDGSLTVSRTLERKGISKIETLESSIRFSLEEGKGEQMEIPLNTTYKLGLNSSNQVEWIQVPAK